MPKAIQALVQLVQKLIEDTERKKAREGEKTKQFAGKTWNASKIKLKVIIQKTMRKYCRTPNSQKPEAQL